MTTPLLPQFRKLRRSARRLSVRLGHFRSDRQGAVAIIFALLFSVMLAMSGLAIDYIRATDAKNKMQMALDAAVIAGAKAASGSEIAVAKQYFEANIATGLGGISSASATFQYDGSGKLSGDSTCSIPAGLSRILGFKKIDVAAHAVAMVDSEQSSNICVLVNHATASQALLVNSGAQVDALDCEMHVRSSANPAAIFNSGSRLKMARICIAGSQIIDNGGIHDTLEKSCSTVSDPFAGKLPEPSSASCTYSNLNFDGGQATLKPGVYCGWMNFNNSPQITFEPGVYVIKNGGWNVNGGTWNGNGVTFYFADTSKIQFNSGVAASVVAPASGSYKELVMYEKSGLSRSQFVFNDAKNMNLEGIIYLPSRDVTFNSGSVMRSKYFTLVVNTLILDQANWQLQSADHNIGGSGGAASGAVKVRLVE